jgi:hypothetical protein
MQELGKLQFGMYEAKFDQTDKAQDMIQEYMDEKHFNNSMNAKIAPIDEVDHTKLIDSIASGKTTRA